MSLGIGTNTPNLISASTSSLTLLRTSSKYATVPRFFLISSTPADVKVRLGCGCPNIELVKIPQRMNM